MYIHGVGYIFLIVPFGNLEKNILKQYTAKEMTLFYCNMSNLSR